MITAVRRSSRPSLECSVSFSQLRLRCCLSPSRRLPCRGRRARASATSPHHSSRSFPSTWICGFRAHWPVICPRRVAS